MIKPEVLPKEIVSLLLDRLKDETTAFYFYRSASNWCKNVGFFKASEYFSKESSDELVHAKGIENFLTDWNVMPLLPSIDKPVTSFKDLQDIIDQAYKLEYELYGEYEDIAAKIFDMKDLSTFTFLQGYITIQKNSVAEYSDMINTLQGTSGNKFELLMLEEILFGD